MRRAGPVLLALAAILAGTAATQPGHWRWDLPAGVAPPPVPADNPMSQAKVDLGRRLFYDGDLSVDGTLSCAHCHVQRRAFADSTPTRPGVHGDPGRRNVQGLANVGYRPRLTWADPDLATLEQQVSVPVFGEDPVEMGMRGMEAELARRLSADPCYVRMFRAAFPETEGVIDMDAVAMALVAFQRTLLSFDSPADRHRRGDETAMSAAARRGEALFSAHCASCHSGQDFTDGQFHAIEDASAAEAGDAGLARATGLAADQGRFRTPSLRNAALTAPYLHDGSAPTLADAIARHSRVPPGAGDLRGRDERDLIAFLDALTDTNFVANPAFTYPDEICAKYPP